MICLALQVKCSKQQKHGKHFINQMKKRHNDEIKTVETKDNDQIQEALVKSENIREEVIDNNVKDEAPRRRKKFRLWKPVRTVTKQSRNDSQKGVINIDKTDINNKTNINSESPKSNKEGHGSTFKAGKKGKTKSLVKSKVSTLHEIQNKPFRTQDKSFKDRCYMRAKLKLDYEKVSTDVLNLNNKPSPSNVTIVKAGNIYAIEQNSSQGSTNALLLKDHHRLSKFNFSSLFANEESTFEKHKKMKNGKDLNQLCYTNNSNNLPLDKQQDKLAFGNLVCMFIVLSTIPLALWGLKIWRNRKYLNEIQFLFRRKSPFDLDSESNKDSIDPSTDTLCRHLEDSSHDSYGSISEDNMKSERTLLNLTRDKVDLSNITLCKNCQLYRFKSMSCCK